MWSRDDGNGGDEERLRGLRRMMLLFRRRGVRMRRMMMVVGMRYGGRGGRVNGGGRPATRSTVRVLRRGSFIGRRFFSVRIGGTGFSRMRTSIIIVVSSHSTSTLVFTTTTTFRGTTTVL